MYIEEVDYGRRRRRDNEEKEVFRGKLSLSLYVSLAYLASLSPGLAWQAAGIRPGLRGGGGLLSNVQIQNSDCRWIKWNGVSVQ